MANTITENETEKASMFIQISRVMEVTGKMMKGMEGASMNILTNLLGIKEIGTGMLKRVVQF